MSELLDVAQLAAYLNISTTTAYGLTRSRAKRAGDPTLPYIRLGKELRFRRSSVDAWLIQKEH